MSFDADCPKVGTTAQHGYACQLAKDAGFSSLLYAVSCATRQSPEAVRLQAKVCDERDEPWPRSNPCGRKWRGCKTWPTNTVMTDDQKATAQSIAALAFAWVIALAVLP